MSDWTTAAQLREQVERLWRSGRLLSCRLSGEELFPRRLTLKVPRPGELADRYGEVRAWMAGLETVAGKVRVVRRTVNNRALGTNAIPVEAWVDSREQAVELIGKRREAAVFDEMVARTKEQRPELLAWLRRRPLRALALAPEWSRLLAVVAWLRCNPRPGIYLRQIDIPGVDTKFTEQHKAVLAELLDLVLPPEAIDNELAGVLAFEERYGFRGKPQFVRFRVLDPALMQPLSAVTSGLTRKLADDADLDFAVTVPFLKSLRIPVQRVFITENEVNYLSFPAVASSIAIFGGGYGLQAIRDVAWLQDVRVHYWGDIDTHGFAILDRLRAWLPEAQSLLMDRHTLLAHKDLWGKETSQETRDLTRLDELETGLYDDLRFNRLGERLRFEQELVRFSLLEEAISRLNRR